MYMGRFLKITNQLNEGEEYSEDDDLGIDMSSMSIISSDSSESEFGAFH
jgi:hypothetical protein